MGSDEPASTAQLLGALAAEDWVWFLGHANAVVADRPADDPLHAALALPVSRLAGGRARALVCRKIAADAALLQQLRDRIAAADPPVAVRAALAGYDDAEREAAQGAAPPDIRHTRLRARVKALTEERNDLQRQLAGATARTAQNEAELIALRETVQQRDVTVQELADQLAATDEARKQLRQRLDRRHENQMAALRTALRDLRRQLEEAHHRLRETTAPSSKDFPAASPADRTPVVQPGRPTRLPDHVVSGTREEAELLLSRGRRVLIDGYNCTLQHHPRATLAEQRDWLVDLAASLAQRRAIAVTVVFDGADGPSTPPALRKRRGVNVQFSPPLISADDDIVLSVEATDDPIVVVTDDRELAARVRAVDADVLGTSPFVWLAR
jgi:hypothetical protein